MKFLHTSDWHLGQKFLHKDRIEEHQLALDWLLETIKQEQVDCLIVAGDIFDIGNPPNYARRLYYKFLTGLLGGCCQHIIIVGGNHDSPSMLNAPRELLRALNVHVIGATSDAMEEDIIELKDAAGNLLAVVAAVPFLRDRDLRSSVAGETGQERIERIRDGIRQHYQQLSQLLEPYNQQHIPVLATGHLFAKGAVSSARQDNIYIGDMENIEAAHFPAVFDYVALGHIHRAQCVEGTTHVHYCGSLIPLSFSETKDEKVVNVVEFKHKKPQITSIAVPAFRRLKTVKGSLDYVQQRLEQLHEKYKDQLPVWVEVIVETDRQLLNLDTLLHDYVQHMNLELLKIRTTWQHQALELEEHFMDLSDLEPIEVFKQRCQLNGISKNGHTEEHEQELLSTFLELQDWMRDTENAGR